MYLSFLGEKTELKYHKNNRFHNILNMKSQKSLALWSRTVKKKCFHLYLLNGRRFLKNFNGSEFNIKSTLNTVIFVKISFQISKHCQKNQKTKISNIFGTDKDIAKIPTVLSSAHHEELVLKISRKFRRQRVKVNLTLQASSSRFSLLMDTAYL